MASLQRAAGVVPPCEVGTEEAERDEVHKTMGGQVNNKNTAESERTHFEPCCTAVLTAADDAAPRVDALTFNSCNRLASTAEQ